MLLHWSFLLQQAFKMHYSLGICCICDVINLIMSDLSSFHCLIDGHPSGLLLRLDLLLCSGLSKPLIIWDSIAHSLWRWSIQSYYITLITSL